MENITNYSNEEKFVYYTGRNEEKLLAPVEYVELPIGKFFVDRFENTKPGDLIMVKNGFGVKGLAIVHSLVNNHSGTNFHDIITRKGDEFHYWDNSHSIVGTEFTSKVMAHNNQKLLDWYNAIPKPTNKLLKALEELLANEGSGCPMCDNGKLRDQAKEHWDDCAWNNARKVLESYK